LLLPLVAITARAGGPRWATDGWAGAEYTPARAPGNQLWLFNYTQYAADVDRELGQLSRHFGFNTIRLFLHNMVFDYDSGATMFKNLDAFLDVASSHGFKTSLGPFWDDCWNGSGASLTEACVPVKGRHNGCWMQSPQSDERVPNTTDYTRFAPYVAETVRRYANDVRIRYIEIYNEPHGAQPTTNWSFGLRHYSYQIAVAMQPSVPVLSCWDANADSQAVDMHRYDTDFGGWTAEVFAAPEQGALITEGGSRWFQGYDSDAGSPLTVMHWFQELMASGDAPFRFGQLLNWEMMVGNSNTRWHWNSPDGAPEPTIPWDAWMFADGTPVSYTEAAVMRNWTLGVNDLLHYSKWLPRTYNFSGDSYLSLTDATPQYATGPLAEPSNYVAETAIWPNATTGFGGGLLVRASTNDQGQLFGYYAGVDPNTLLLTLELWYPAGRTQIGDGFNMSSLDCGLVSDGWNMLRVVANGSQIDVYANPMAPEAFSPSGIQPRISWVDPNNFYPEGEVMLAVRGEGEGSTRFDYLGVMPLSVLA